MIGDPYVLQDVQRIPTTAVPFAWPGKIVVFLYNERNTVTNILVVDDDCTPIAWPDSLEDEIAGLVVAFKSEIVARVARLSMVPPG